MTGEIRDYQMFPVPFTTGPISNPITGAGNTGNLNVEGWGSLAIVIDITAFSGVTSVTFSIDEFDPTSGKFVSLAATAALTAVSTTRLTIAQLFSQFIRLSWTLNGTPSVTCTVSAKFRAS